MKKLLIIGAIVVVAIVGAVFLLNSNDSNVNNDNINNNNNNTNNNVIVDSIDENLSGAELLQSINYEIPENFKYEMKSEDFEFGEVVNYTIYMKDGSFRMEGKMDGESYVMIYNDKDKITYQYSPDTKEGTIFEDDDSEDDFDSGFTQDDYDNYAEYFEDEELVSAEVTKLDGEKVILVEVKEDEYSTEKTYISTKTGLPMVIESYEDGELLMKQTLVNVETNGNISDSLFEKPEGINFTEFNLDDMFNDLEYDFEE